MAVTPTPPDPPSTFMREVTGLQHFVEEFEKTGTGDDLNKKVAQLKYVIRQTVRGETDEAALEKISKELGRLEDGLNTLKRQVKVHDTSLPHTIQRVDAIAKNLKVIHKLKASVDNKAQIYRKKKEFAAQEGESKENPIPRFDLLYRKMKQVESPSPIVEETWAAVKKIQLKNAPVTSEDQINLGNAVLALDEVITADITMKIFGLEKAEAVALKNYLEGLQRKIIETMQLKQKLLSDLNTSMAEEIGKKGVLTPEDQLKYAIWYFQIINNPFEMPLNSSLLDYRTAPLVEKEIEQWNKLKIPHNKWTLQCKTEGLQRLRKAVLKEESKELVLISGAGPGGLMAALAAGVQGTEFTLIESRGKENEDKMRKNILALGKEDSSHHLPVFEALNFHQGVATHAEKEAADEKLLEFLGVTDRLIVDGKVDATQLFFSVKIGALQGAMKQQLCALMEKEEDALIQYNTVIGDIRAPKDSTERATVILTSLKQDDEKKAKAEATATSISPTAVYVMEGARSSTRSLLGIDVSKQTTTERIGFAFFERKKAEGIIEMTTALTNYLKALWTIFKLGMSALLSGKVGMTYEAFFAAFNRFELLLSTPENDYFYFTASKEEYDQYTHILEQRDAALKQREEWADQMLKELTAKQKQYEVLSPKRKEALEALVRLDYEHEDYSETPITEAFTACISAFQPGNRAAWFDNEQERHKVFERLSIISDVMDAHREGDRPDERAATELAIFDEAAEKLRMWEQTTLIEPRAVQQVPMTLMGRVKRWTRDSNYKKFLDLPNLVTAVFWVVSEGISSGIATYNRLEHTQTQVKRAETSYKPLGSTHFYIGGDAASTTDPASGSGCRTSILRAALAADTLNHSDRLKDPMEASVFRWTSTIGERAMREEGLDLRQGYAGPTERLERYLDIAEDAGAISLEDRNFLLRMQGKMRLHEVDSTVTISAEEMTKLRRIREKFRIQYAENSIYLEDAINKVKEAKRVENVAPFLTEEEFTVFMEAWQTAMEGSRPPRTSEQVELLRSATGKVAQILSSSDKELRLSQGYYAEAWFVALDTAVQQMQNTFFPS